MSAIISLILFLFAHPSAFAQQVQKPFPPGEADTLAQYEQPELLAVRQDLADCVDDEQLHADWDRLVVLDKFLHVEDVI